MLQMTLLHPWFSSMREWYGEEFNNRNERNLGCKAHIHIFFTYLHKCISIYPKRSTNNRSNCIAHIVDVMDNGGRSSVDRDIKLRHYNTFSLFNIKVYSLSNVNFSNHKPFLLFLSQKQCLISVCNLGRRNSPRATGRSDHRPPRSCSGRAVPPRSQGRRLGRSPWQQ